MITKRVDFLRRLVEHNIYLDHFIHINQYGSIFSSSIFRHLTFITVNHRENMISYPIGYFWQRLPIPETLCSLLKKKRASLIIYEFLEAFIHQNTLDRDATFGHIVGNSSYSF